MQPDFLKVRGRPDLIREKRSNGILNTDVSALNKYREERDEKLKLNQVIAETQSLKSDIAEIKSLLQAILGQK